MGGEGWGESVCGGVGGEKTRLWLGKKKVGEFAIIGVALETLGGLRKRKYDYESTRSRSPCPPDENAG